jgi:hypothetical protein
VTALASARGRHARHVEQQHGEPLAAQRAGLEGSGGWPRRGAVLLAAGEDGAGPGRDPNDPALKSRKACRPKIKFA